MQETQAQWLGRQDPPEKEAAIDSSVPAWEILWTEELGGPQRVRQDSATKPQQKTKLLPLISLSLWETCFIYH